MTYWNKEEHGKHSTSDLLAVLLRTLFPKESPIIDYGCGLGFYVKRLRDAGFKIQGVEGDENINSYSEIKDIIIRDLGIPWVFEKSNTLSLEVGEHIAPEYADIFLDNITDSCLNRAVISWALPNQGGYRHENEQPNEYVINKMALRGFTLNKELTDWIRVAMSRDDCFWFKNTLMVFDKI